MCDRASYVRLTRGTNLMQQLDSNLHTVHKTTHRLLRTTATQHHMQQHTICTPEDGHIDIRSM